MSHLCVSIFVTDIAQTQRDIALAAEAGADMVELRIDTTDPTTAHDLVKASPLPVIVTRRPEWEGGQSEEPDDRRLQALFTAADLDATYVDVELKSASLVPALSARTTRDTGPRFIVSSHDFTTRPARLTNLVHELADSGADVTKIVWTARSIRDNLEAFEILQHRARPTIALCMGEAGVISRILAKKFGAFLTFASLDRAGATAPGQVSIDDMKKLYRWDAINADTRVYGVVAQPVAHSMSPAIHNAAFDETGFNGVYLPLLVEGGYESFKAFMESFIHFDALRLSGLSITIPHKENALRYLRENNAGIEPLAERIGAVNTIIIRRDPAPAGSGESPTVTLEGLNTDYAAILDSITAKLGIARERLKDYRVAVLGAGGTGRTAVAALAHYGATVVVYNRTRERAEALAAEFNGKTGQVIAASMDKLGDSECHIFINTTSVGMHPDIDADPFDGHEQVFSERSLVFDAIYNPPRTRLLERAQAQGAKTIGGIEMFIRQAASQFEAWTGLPAPHDAMRRVIESRLAR